MSTFLRAITFWEFMNFLDSQPFAGWRKVQERLLCTDKGGRVAQAAEAEGKNKSLEMRFPEAAWK